MTITAAVVMAALTYLPYCDHHNLRSSICSCSSRSNTAISVPCKEKLPTCGHEPCRHFVCRQRHLLASFPQWLNCDSIGGRFVVADDERETCAARVRAFHLRLERSSTRIEDDREPGIAQRLSDAAREHAGRFAGMHNVHERRLDRLPVGALQEKHQTFDADREATRRRRFPSQLREQPIVAAPACNGALSAEFVRNPFEHGAVVVIESPHETRIDFESDAGLGQEPLQLVEVLARL